MSAKESGAAKTFTISQFHEYARDALCFLIEQHGFREGEPYRVGREAIFTFEKCPVAVSVVFEGGIPEVTLDWFTAAGRHYAYLHHLTRRFISPHFPKLSKPLHELRGDEYTAAFATCLRVQADFLLKHGKRFLGGDYSLVAANVEEWRQRRKPTKPRSKKKSTN